MFQMLNGRIFFRKLLIFIDGMGTVSYIQLDVCKRQVSETGDRLVHLSLLLFPYESPERCVAEIGEGLARSKRQGGRV